MAIAIIRDQRHRCASTTVHFERERALKAHLIAFERRTQFALERRVAGLPDQLTNANASPIDIAVAETQRAPVRGVAARLEERLGAVAESLKLVSCTYSEGEVTGPEDFVE